MSNSPTATLVGRPDNSDLYDTPLYSQRTLEEGAALPIGSRVRAAFIYSSYRDQHNVRRPLYIRVEGKIIQHSPVGALLETPTMTTLLGIHWDLI